jgi:aminocarboxymuconate-semialdehyde decarboxylase
MLGSDYPFPLGEQEPGKLIEESKSLSDLDKSKLLGLNAMEFFKSTVNRDRWIKDTTSSKS